MPAESTAHGGIVLIASFRYLAVACLQAITVVSLSQLAGASPLYDQKDLSSSDAASDVISNVLGVSVDADPNLSTPKKPRLAQATSHETTSFSASDDESDFTDALSSPLLPRDSGSSASKNAVYSGLESNSVGSSSYIYAAHDAGDLTPDVVPPDLVASFPAFDVQSSNTAGKTIDDFDSSGNSGDSNEPETTGGDWEAPIRTSVVPSSGFGSFSEDLLTGNFGNAGSLNGGNYGYNPGLNGYLGTLGGDTGGGADPLDLTGRKGQKARLGAFASTAEPEGAGIAVVALILLFVVFYRRSSSRIRSARR
jgi:hypothetical protein